MAAMARQTTSEPDPTEPTDRPVDESLADLNARIAAAGAAATTAEARGGSASSGGLVGVTAGDAGS